jgi:DNA-binding transcriptional ArsR family regulator
MGSIQDLLQEVPLAAALKQRLALADQKYEAALREVEDLKRKIADLEHENAALRAQIPRSNAPPLREDDSRVLVQIFRARGQENPDDVGAMAEALEMEKGVLQHHLDRLREAGLAEVTGGNFLHGHVYWALTSEGRRRLVEGQLI